MAAKYDLEGKILQSVYLTVTELCWQRQESIKATLFVTVCGYRLGSGLRLVLVLVLV